MATYTLDRITDGMGVLLLRTDENVKKNIPIEFLPLDVKEGDILDITFIDNEKIDKIVILKKETNDALDTASSLLEKLKNKKN